MTTYINNEITALQCNSILKKSTSSKRNQACNVSFSPQAQLVYIETLAEFTNDEIISAYYQEYEYKEIRAGNKILTKNIKKGMFCEENEGICYRGLEHKTEEASRRRRRARFEAAMAVFDEQMRQCQEGVVNEEMIRDAYESESYMCQEVAYEAAARDAIEANKSCIQESEPNTQSIPQNILHAATTEDSCAAVNSVISKDDLTSIGSKSDISSIGSKSFSSPQPPTHFKGLLGLIVNARQERTR